MTERPTLLFYCQHSVGLGHLVRSFALCRELARRFRVVLVCGGKLPRAIEPPPGVEIVPLPPLGVGPDGTFVSRDGRRTTDRARMVRRELLVRTFRQTRPKVVLVELFPFGRPRFAAELLPLLDEARHSLVVCSVRDILVTGRRDQRGHDEWACALANRYFDAVLVHADPRVARLEESFSPPAPLQVPVHYTGFVVPNGGPPARQVANAAPRVVVSAGGGLVGEPLLRTAIDAHALLWPTERIPMRVIGGPFLPDPAWAALQGRAAGRKGLSLRRSVPDMGVELASASASISQCGYNTALEVMQAGVPALVVPYAAPGEDEQTRRARLLERRGALRVLDPEFLDAPRLVAQIRELLDFTPRAQALDVDGAANTARMLSGLLGELPVHDEIAVAS